VENRIQPNVSLFFISTGALDYFAINRVDEGEVMTMARFVDSLRCASFVSAIGLRKLKVFSL
jgi:hypothetical protein